LPAAATVDHHQRRKIFARTLTPAPGNQRRQIFFSPRPSRRGQTSRTSYFALPWPRYRFQPRRFFLFFGRLCAEFPIDVFICFTFELHSFKPVALFSKTKPWPQVESRDAISKQ